MSRTRETVARARVPSGAYDSADAILCVLITLAPQVSAVLRG